MFKTFSSFSFHWITFTSWWGSKHRNVLHWQIFLLINSSSEKLVFFHRYTFQYWRTFSSFSYIYVYNSFSILCGQTLKSLVLGSNISSTESDVNIHIEKVPAAIDISIIWKSDFSDKRNGFLPSYSLVISTVLMHLLDANETHMLRSFLNKFWKQQTTDVRPSTSHLPNNPSKMNKIYWALLRK